MKTNRLNKERLTSSLIEVINICHQQKRSSLFHEQREGYRMRAEAYTAILRLIHSGAYDVKED